MNREFKKVFLALFLLHGLFPCYSQVFEGTITLHVTSGEIDNTSILTVKDDRTVLELALDSTEVIKIIKDFGTESSIVLRSKYGLKYGIRTSIIPGSTPPEADEDKTFDVRTEVTDSVKLIGNRRCTKIILLSPVAIAEAWVTTEPGFKLSKYFPEFLGKNSNKDFYDLRKTAEQHGLVVKYWEKLLGTNTETNVEVSLKEHEIQNEAFSINPEYLVLDNQGMRQLYTDAQGNEIKKKQWEEFMILFGNK